MSLNIWTQCEGLSNAIVYQAAIARVIESQHRIGTRKLCRSDQEQALLERLIDDAKPPVPTKGAFADLHYLLFTPFRYPPLRHGSRFGARGERGIFYGAEKLATVFAEMAYYRFVFLDGTAADLAPLSVELSTFRVHVRSAVAIDCCAPPFSAYAGEISSPTSYAASQALGRAMRADAVDLFRYTSARCPDGGANIGLFSPAAFAEPRPYGLKTWLCVADRSVVEVSRKDYLAGPERYRFARAVMEVDGILPAPAP
ncbi:MAG TPA: RES family NAD+ phosphorylase [Kofleriaceae bacterium]|nr:RES family NAD+ phosphorylase [Kofleriaceae bacterium]